jgi:hypothetical protein
MVIMADKKPTRLTLRVYQVGFGDCFLLTFHYPSTKRHILIDFGSTGLPKGSRITMEAVAKDIEKQCKGQLHAVVATHRHKDHISGFATDAKKTGPGDIIARCKPQIVIQPWTEDPKADPKTGKVKTPGQAFVSSLRNMHEVADATLKEIDLRRASFGKTLQRELGFLGEDNLSNLSAVKNLMTIAKNHYVHYGTSSGLEKILPGVDVRVLGPPNLDQSGAVRKMRSEDKQEYWHLQAMASQAVVSNKKSLFKGAAAHSGPLPPYARWFVKRMRSLRGEQLLGIMRALDKVMNNTSIILLFTIGKKKLLFPGDAQIENWSYTLSKAADRKALQGVTLYKVGHHGSLNATPKSVWNAFTNKGPKSKKDRLRSFMSTMTDKHGKVASGTEVPRSKLVTALDTESDLFSTHKPKMKELARDFEIDLS